MHACIRRYVYIYVYIYAYVLVHNVRVWGEGVYEVGLIVGIG